MYLLQQSYGVMHMSAYIAESISAEEDLNSNALLNIEERINRFLVKNTTASISHVGHHNKYYSYIEKELNVKEDMESLNRGVDALEEILYRKAAEAEKQKNEIVQTAFSIISIIGVLSVPSTLIEFFQLNPDKDAVAEGVVDSAVQGITTLDNPILNHFAFFNEEMAYWIAIVLFVIVFVFSFGIYVKWIQNIMGSILRAPFELFAWIIMFPAKAVKTVICLI